jgi:hypothetical protein
MLPMIFRIGDLDLIQGVIRLTLAVSFFKAL